MNLSSEKSKSGPRKLQIAPSVLAANFAHLEEDVKKAEAAGVDCLHVDIMDGHFVPNLSFGPEIVATLKRITRLPLDVHLMIQQPDRYARTFIEAGADTLTVHLEAYHDVRRTLGLIRDMGCRCGLAINPLTLFQNATSLLKKVDLLLCMTVNPGFGGQPFIIEVLEKVRLARAYAEQHGLTYDIEVDGGLTSETIGPSVAAGANVIVAGTSVFGQKDVTAAVRTLRNRAAEVSAGG
ncbi:MAG: ribulose-phosphate 3-epimerase [Candidatus Methylacidiphilales bacterium]|nr:ribulose-phosphate 3-epimerase [Candidatus Methylacidiphilales bacterium]